MNGPGFESSTSHFSFSQINSTDFRNPASSRKYNLWTQQKLRACLYGQTNFTCQTRLVKLASQEVEFHSGAVKFFHVTENYR